MPVMMFGVIYREIEHLADRKLAKERMWKYKNVELFLVKFFDVLAKSFYLPAKIIYKLFLFLKWDRFRSVRVGSNNPRDRRLISSDQFVIAHGRMIRLSEHRL